MAVWRAGFRALLDRTAPKPEQKYWFLQRPKAIGRVPVGTVEHVIRYIRMEAEQQRVRDLTRSSAARRICCGPTVGRRR